MSVLVVFKIFRSFANTWTPDGKYSLHKREILKQKIQIQLSQELMICSQYFIAFAKSI